MPSAIDPTQPATGAAVLKAEQRANWAAAKAEIEALQAHAVDAVGEFGVVGDGATDNAAALIAMRQALRQDTSKLYRIFFPPGDYRYTNNRWLFGIPLFILDA